MFIRDNIYEQIIIIIVIIILIIALDIGYRYGHMFALYQVTQFGNRLCPESNWETNKLFTPSKSRRSLSNIASLNTERADVYEYKQVAL